jgi:tRNA/rRNA methyltransferase
MAMASKALALGVNNRIAMVFGPEDLGLSNEELELCNDVVSIPTALDATSINLSHAVIIICYELFRAATGEQESAEQAEIASADLTEAMYDHMRDALLDIGFLNRQNPDYTLGMIRRILTRSALTVPEVKLIRGMFRQLVWYVKNRGER